MRWLVAVAVVLAGCGGADDGEEVFGADASATHYGPSGLPDCVTTCDKDRRVECSVPGKSKAELEGMYSVVETYEESGTTKTVKFSAEEEPQHTKYGDGLVTHLCFVPGSRVEFVSK